VDPERFEELVDEALEDLPREFADRLENIDIITEPRPSKKVLREMGLLGHGTLLGLYQGIPHTRRTSDYGNVLPDRILIYREPVLAEAAETQGPDETLEDAVREVVRDTVLHEIGHHFGLSDPDLEDVGY
jgi:predicted Zn-dependent protease with MMP-like domain